MIAWCGSSSDGLAWLRERCHSLDHMLTDETLSIASLDALCDQHPQRLIVAIENRLSYPEAEIHHLQRTWPEVPFALALASWFDGSRRTGIGTVSHLSLPWYRWWDGWKPWLSGSQAELLNPWPRVLPPAPRQQTTSSSSTGLIISNCVQTGEAWKVALAGTSADQIRVATVQVLTLAEFQSQLASPLSTPPDWILWDDSSLDTSIGSTCLSDVCELFSSIRNRYPQVFLIVATSMPRWTDWQEWNASGVNELLAKPSQGLQIAEMLQTA